MLFRNIEVRNFMSVVKADINLENRGLVLIQGDNNDSDAFESNGSGKSTLFSESIVWALFGETIRGVKGDKVVNRNVGRDTSVSVELLDDNGDLYVIERFRKHKDHKNHVLMYKNGKNITAKSDKDTDAMIIELIQMDYATFTNSIMFGQGMSKTFSVSTDSEQKKILENMLQIDVYKHCMEIAKEKVKGLKETLTDLDKKLQRHQTSYQSSTVSLEDTQEEEAKLGERVKKRIQELTDEQEHLKANVSSKENSISLSYTVDLEKNKKRRECVTEKLASMTKYSEMATELEILRRSSEKDIADTQRQIRAKRRELDDLISGKNVPKTCSACGQSLPLKDTTHLQNHIKDAIEELENNLEGHHDELNDAETGLDKLQTKLEKMAELETELKSIDKNINNLENSIRFISREIDSLNDNIKRIGKQIREQEALLSKTYSELIEKLIAKIEEEKQQMEIIETEVGQVKEELRLYEFWVDAFGNQGIKSVMLDSVTPFLNQRANEYLQELADSSIEVEFTTQDRLKNGELRDKFSVKVSNENGDDEYKGNSGGEKRRVDVAISMALQDLVMSRSNKRLHLIVYDEVFDALDSIGCEKVIQLLNAKAKQFGTVLVVTHNDNLKQLFSNSITVSKVNGRTKVVG